MQLHNRKNQSGVTLVELMIAIAITLFLVAGLIQIFLSNKQAYHTQSGMARVQETARFVTRKLGEDLRMADFGGCRNLSRFAIGGTLNNNLVVNANATDGLKYIMNANYGVFGHNSNGSSSWSPALASADLSVHTELSASSVLEGSDVVSLRHMSSTTYRLPQAYTANSVSVVITASSSPYSVGDILVLGDCTKATLFQVTGTSSSGNLTTIFIAASGAIPGNAQTGLLQDYAAGSWLGKLETAIYYVDASQSRSLRRDILATQTATAQRRPEAIVDGVTNFNVLYGIDTTGDGAANQYLDANAVNTTAPVAAADCGDAGTLSHSWYCVVSVRMAITVESGLTTKTEDSVLRRFVSVIGLRNRAEKQSVILPGA